MNSNTLYSTNRKIVPEKGRDWVAIIFLVSLLVMVVFVFFGVVDHDAGGGRALVYYGLYPAFIVNILGVRYAIKFILNARCQEQ
jgi:hypothetical protein